MTENPDSPRSAREALRIRTLDADGVCVRCGAPDIHCWCEAVADDGHWWVAPSVGANNTEWTVCMKCGIVKRQDGKPSSQCRGPVRVGLRDIPDVELPGMWSRSDFMGGPDD